VKQYLLSVCYLADGVPPTPEAMTRIMADVEALNGPDSDA
jgi:hypothetical protein